MARAISIARNVNTNGNLDSFAALVLLAFIAFASVSTMAGTDLAAVHNGINDFSHYSE